MAGRLEGRVALVTGGSSGIGRATALAFAQEGARVVIGDVDQEGGEQTVRQVEAEGGKALCLRADVSQASQVEALVEQTVAAYGRLDIGFNNAADVAAHLGALVPTHEYPEENWDRVMEVNLKGVWLCLKYEIRQMLKQGSGAIVNAASALGLVGVANMSGYVASKHGVVGLTRAAALEYADKGIRVNAVCPGYIRTPMTASRLADPAGRARLLEREPIGRVGEPEEVAQAVVWLCSDAASFVTGHALAVDGGWVAQ
jgi:NAD(P)-dependent dehydrogenase (short-subunit alcohol dehydrogenase family)